MTRPSRIDRSRLPPGTHGIDRADVVQSQRLRMFYGLADSMVERGYAATTVADIVSRAGVSRRTFYEQFADRSECFVAAFDYCFNSLTALLNDSIVDVDRSDWRALLRATLRAYLRGLADNGVIAQVLHVASFAAGQAVADRRRTMKTALAGRMAGAFAIGRESGDIPTDVPMEAFEALIGAIDDRVRDCIEVRGSGALPGLEDQLYLITVAVFGLPEW